MRLIEFGAGFQHSPSANALSTINENNCNKPILLRNKTVRLTESITQQITHYLYRIGQAFIGKMIINKKWNSSSIPKGKSNECIQPEFTNNLK